MSKPFKDLVDRMSPEARERIDAWVKELLAVTDEDMRKFRRKANDWFKRPSK